MIEPRRPVRRWVTLAATIVVGFPCGSAPAAVDQTQEIGLRECLAQAMRSNPELRIEQLSLTRSSWAIRGARAAFWPAITAETGLGLGSYPSLESADGSGFRRLAYQLGLGGLLPLGTTYQLGLNGTVTWSEGTSSATSGGATADTATYSAGLLSPEHTPGLALTLTQPLLRGAWLEANLGPLRVARADHRVARAQFTRFVHDLLHRVARAYYELHAARRLHAIAEQGVDLARRQLSRTRLAARGGKSSGLDLLESELALARRHQQRISAEQSVLGAERALRELLFNRRRPGEKIGFGGTLVPRGSPLPPGEPLALEKLAARALKRRPDLEALALQLDARHHELRVVENGTLPQLDAYASLTLSSLSGSGETSEYLGEHAIGDHGSAWSQVARARYPSFEVGLRFEWPVSRDAREAAAQQQRVEKRRSERMLTAARSRAMLEVSEAYQRLASSRGELANAVLLRRLAQANLEGVEKKSRAGLGDAFDVIRAQENLIEAESSLVRARQAVTLSRLDLEAAGGTLPDLLEVRISPQ